MRIVFPIIACMGMLIAGCVSIKTEGQSTYVVVESQPLTVDSRPCTGAFTAHQLPHITLSDKDRIGLYQGHGACVALADLNGDKLVDIVLAGQNAPTRLLWNKGALSFSRETLNAEGSRAVNAVDVNGDGRLDLVFTHSGNSPSFWRAGGSSAKPVFTRVASQEFIDRQNPFAITRCVSAVATTPASPSGFFVRSIRDTRIFIIH